MKNCCLYGLLFLSYLGTAFSQNENITLTGKNDTSQEDTDTVAGTDTLGASEDTLLYQDVYSSSLPGYWHFSDSIISITSNENNTAWKIISGNVFAEMNRIDRYRIEHSASYKFSWEAFPEKLIPGKVNYVAAYFENIDNSTTTPVASGIIIKMDDKYGSSQSFSEILKKGNEKNAIPELAIGYFYSPLYNGKDTELLILVHCYIGGDHYSVTYKYKWIN
ncbi:MAG: hypothetical protein EHM58_13615 [Ignavibacteriae bacterium]|nr:MAG: hypothetical protein EHM58_13615 [Ignavibacteriota bacterium]